MYKTSLISTTLICLLTSFNYLSAQTTQNERESLFGNVRKIKIENMGYFFAPNLSFTSLDRSNAMLLNLSGGVTFKDKVSLGGYYSSSLNEIVPLSETIPDIYMDYWSAGAMAEFTFNSNKLIHLSFPLFIGYGEVEMDNNLGNLALGEANFFQIEPSALMEINLNDFLRFNLGLSYRLVSKVEYRNLDQNDLSGLNGRVGLKVGLFR